MNLENLYEFLLSGNFENLQEIVDEFTDTDINNFSLEKIPQDTTESIGVPEKIEEIEKDIKRDLISPVVGFKQVTDIPMINTQDISTNILENNLQNQIKPKNTISEKPSGEIPEVKIINVERKITDIENTRVGETSTPQQSPKELINNNFDNSSQDNSEQNNISINFNLNGSEITNLEIDNSQKKFISTLEEISESINSNFVENNLTNNNSVVEALGELSSGMIFEKSQFENFTNDSQNLIRQEISMVENLNSLVSFKENEILDSKTITNSTSDIILQNLELPLTKLVSDLVTNKTTENINLLNISKENLLTNNDNFQKEIDNLGEITISEKLTSISNIIKESLVTENSELLKNTENIFPILNFSKIVTEPQLLDTMTNVIQQISSESIVEKMISEPQLLDTTRNVIQQISSESIVEKMVSQPQILEKITSNFTTISELSSQLSNVSEISPLLGPILEKNKTINISDNSLSNSIQILQDSMMNTVESTKSMLEENLPKQLSMNIQTNRVEPQPIALLETNRASTLPELSQVFPNLPTPEIDNTNVTSPQIIQSMPSEMTKINQLSENVVTTPSSKNSQEVSGMSNDMLGGLMSQISILTSIVREISTKMSYIDEDTNLSFK